MNAASTPVYSRYAVYYTPSGALGQRGAQWLGWDVAAAMKVAQPDIEGLDIAAITQTPRKYGFHGTLKPPFALREGKTENALRDGFQTLCAHLKPVALQELQVTRLGRFLALTPQGPQDALNELAACCVRELDGFRAPPGDAELARRRKSNLSPAQERNLIDWGYPHVMEAFRFHMTLTQRVGNANDIAPLVRDFFAPTLPTPFVIDALTLVGEMPNGMFVQIERRLLGE